MKIIEPSVELWQQRDPIAHVARCARVCYGNKEGKSTDQQLYDSLLKSGHNSMFRHESVYAIAPLTQIEWKEWDCIAETPYIKYKVDYEFDDLYVVANVNWIIDRENENYDSDNILSVLEQYQVSPEVFNDREIGHSMMRYTFHITTQISTSRELNRVSPNNIAEKSTRYCAEEGTIVRPHWLDIDIAKEFNANPSVDVFEFNHPYLENEADYFMACKNSFRQYRNMIGRGMKKQDARGVLPLDTATEVVYTYSIDEWKHIIELRGSKRAHPNAQIIANMIKSELEQLGYEL